MFKISLFVIFDNKNDQRFNRGELKALKTAFEFANSLIGLAQTIGGYFALFHGIYNDVDYLKRAFAFVAGGNVVAHNENVGAGIDGEYYSLGYIVVVDNALHIHIVGKDCAVEVQLIAKHLGESLI